VTAAPYSGLTPDVVLDALAGIGLAPDGRLLALNSFENRVYQAGMEDAAPVVVKFYRPARWTDAQILEEHAFALELAESEIPVVAPLVTGGRTQHAFGGFRFAVYPRRGGRMLRPSLCIASARAFGASVQDAVRSAVGLELLHNAFLVHDDVEDESDARRGRPTLHALHGVAVAVNVGDALALHHREPARLDEGGDQHVGHAEPQVRLQQVPA